MRLVFVSSTFKDMQLERDQLKVRVAPQIDAFLAKYGENVHFGDLRWGVNTSELDSEESSNKVLKVCLDEIDNCRPYMIVFIGERYGWIPSAELLENAMEMKGITGVPSDISVTNLEIEYGALLNPDYEGRILFYFREPIDTKDMDEETRKIYEAESPLHKQKLDELKKRIQEKYPDFTRTYKVKFDKKSQTITGLESLMEMINEDLKRIFELDLEALNKMPAPQRAIMNSEAYFEKFSKNAVSRIGDEIAPFKEELFEEKTWEELTYDELPLLEYIYGEVGSGRKTLLALKYERAKMMGLPAVPYASGFDEFTSGKKCFKDVLCYKLEEYLNKEHLEEYRYEYLIELVDELEQSDKEPLHIFVANSNYQILEIIGYIYGNFLNLYKLSFHIQSNNTKEPEPLPFNGHNKAIKVPLLQPEERDTFIKAIAKTKHKEISQVVINKILEKEDSRSPLYLSLIVERLLMLDHEDFQNIRKLGDGMEAINKYMLSIVEKCGSNIKDISKDLLKELVERTNPEMAKKLIAHLSSPAHLNPSGIEEFFKYYGWPYNDLDYSLFTRYLPSLFAVRAHKDDILWFSNNYVKQAAKEIVEYYHESDLFKEFEDWLNNNIKNNEYIAFSNKALIYLYKNNNMPEKLIETWVNFMNSFPEDHKNNDDDVKIINQVYRTLSECVGEMFEDEIEFNDDCFLMKAANSLAQLVSRDGTRNYYTTISLYLMHFVSPIRSNDQIRIINKYLRKLTILFQSYYDNNPNNDALHFLWALCGSLYMMTYRNINNPDPDDIPLITALYMGKVNVYINGLSDQKAFKLGMFRDLFGDAMKKGIDLALNRHNRPGAVSFIKNMEDRYATLDKVSTERIEKMFNDEDFDISLRDTLDLYMILPIFAGALSVMSHHREELGSQYALDYYFYGYEKIAGFLYRKLTNPFDYNFSSMDTLIYTASFYSYYGSSAKKVDEDLELDEDLLFESIHRVCEFSAIYRDYSRAMIELLRFAAFDIPYDEAMMYHVFIYDRSKYYFKKSVYFDKSFLDALLTYIEIQASKNSPFDKSLKKQLRQDALELIFNGFEKCEDADRDDFIHTSMYSFEKSTNKEVLSAILDYLKEKGYSKKYIKEFKKDATYYMS